MFLHYSRKIPAIAGVLFLILQSLNGYAGSDSTGKKHHLLILPLIARSIETDWSAGLAGSFTYHLKKHHDTTTRTSNLQAIALYSIRHQFVIALNGTTYFPKENYIFNQQISYSYFPDNFWGLGKVAPNEKKESYKYRQFYIYLHPQRHIGRDMYVGMLYEFQKLFSVEYDKGGLFDQQQVVGRNGYHISGFGLSFTYDTRNHAFVPDKGLMLQAFFNYFNPVFLSNYTYTNYVFDMRKYIRTYKDQVLALQLFGYFTHGDVPLRSLANFGGANNMRGYYDGRFRDNNQIVFQSEYRAHLFWRIGAVVFGDIGNVGNSLKDMNFDYLKYTYGGGLRLALNKKERLNLRVDYGIGRGNSSGLYLQLAEAF